MEQQKLQHGSARCNTMTAASATTLVHAQHKVTHLRAKETTIIHPFEVADALREVTWVVQNRSFDENHPSARLYEVTAVEFLQ